EALLKPARRVAPGHFLALAHSPVNSGAEEHEGFELVEKTSEGTAILRWKGRGDRPLDASTLQEIGLPPLPPYIHPGLSEDHSKDYQTVYASQPGSAAAPTAGMHFTQALLASLSSQGIRQAFV